MGLSTSSVQEFKEIYKKEFGEELPDDKALELATNFLNLIREILEPVPKEANKNEY